MFVPLSAMCFPPSNELMFSPPVQLFCTPSAPALSAAAAPEHVPPGHMLPGLLEVPYLIDGGCPFTMAPPQQWAPDSIKHTPRPILCGYSTTVAISSLWKGGELFLG